MKYTSFWPRAKKRSGAQGSREGRPDAALRIAFIGGRGVGSKYSGIETYYEEVGSGLASAGHEVTIYCRNYFTPAVKEFRGIKIIRLPAVRSKHLETFTHSLLSTLHSIFCSFDIVHYHALGPSLFSIIPRLFGKATIASVQGLDWQREKWGRLARWFLLKCERLAITCPDATIVVSRSLQLYYKEKYGRSPSYIPNGVCNPVKHQPQEILKVGLEPNGYILFLGRLSPEKNCHLLMNAYKNIDTNLKLVFAGGSSHSDMYVAELMKGQSERIRFLGFVSGRLLQELLANALVFVLPSTIEGGSMALLEAMSYGVCVVASDLAENGK